MTLHANTPQAAGQARRSLEYIAQTQPRYYLRNGSQYLHWSGAKMTDHKSEAYIGLDKQVKSIRAAIKLAAECRVVMA